MSPKYPLFLYLIFLEQRGKNQKAFEQVSMSQSVRCHVVVHGDVVEAVNGGPHAGPNVIKYFRLHVNNAI